MWEDFVKYNSIRTNFLKTFGQMNFKAGDNLLPYFLQKYEETGSIFESWLFVNKLEVASNNGLIISEVTINKFRDYKENWWLDKTNLKYLKELFPDMISSNYEIKNLETVIPNFSPLSIEEFYLITKGKYYLGYDLDEDLGKMIPYVKDQELIENNLEGIMSYFKFRYDNFDLSLLCEYCAFPFGTHESRSVQYRKTKQLEFDYPKEMSKYPVKDMLDKFLAKDIDVSGTRVINIRGTNGSGKTTMVNNIYVDSVAKGKAEERTFNLTDAKGKGHKRYYDILWDKNTILLGGYNTPYGTKGTDRIGDVYEIIEGILFLVSNFPKFTIVMESATVSTSFWSYALLFIFLKQRGVEINIVHLWMKDWDFIVNNIKNRTERKEGAKEPDYQGAIDKREILFKNHFRFSSLIGKESMLVMYPDICKKEEMHEYLSYLLEKETGRGLL